MSIVSIETAINHLRADAGDSVDIQHKLDAAQEIAEQFIGRRIYANYLFVYAAAKTAMAEMESLIAEKETVLKSSVDDYLKNIQREQLDSRWYEILMAARGIATNGAIEVAILLILGTLYEHREDVVAGVSVTKLPIAAEHRLQPYRIMGL